MTLEQFLERLRETPRDWFLLNGTRLRREGTIQGETLYCCPLREVFQAMEYITPAENAFGNKELPDRIMEAADSIRREPTLRQQLLEACGLVERV